MKLQKLFTALVFILGTSPLVMGQEILPFPPTESGSTASRTIQESVYSPVEDEKYLPEDAPNIIIVIIDDVGPGQTSTFGGEIYTPTMDRIAGEGIAYNRFHTTAMCSPTRASLLTGRNHHLVGAGQIAELANDWDGYSGTQPKTSAMIPEVLKNYGYHTGAWGKWHNTPAIQTTAAGPFDFWPTGYGFEYFYGFLAGEASQYEPHMVRNTTVVHPNKPIDGKPYHLTEDIAQDAIEWLQTHKAFSPDKPFFMYWAPGAAHGPHQVAKEWADKYKGKFDDGWDNYRERVFENAKDKDWIPQDAQLTPRPASLPAWSSIPENELPFQRRLMEVYAGFVEHTDVQVGKVVDEVERLGYGDNTLIFYIWGDNGASAEGQAGTISELLAQNGIPSTIDQHMDALDELGGLDVLGSAKTDNMYHGAWAWAGSTPYQSTKLIAAHFGGTRNPMAVRWPKKIKADATPRAQFHHVNDIVPTIYEILAIEPPEVVNGFQQDPIQGVSMVYTFDDVNAKGRMHTQYFEIMGSRGIYDDGWFACAKGPREPWVPGVPAGMFDENGQLLWNPDNDVWELYNLEEDWSQANDLSEEMPEKLDQMQALFMIEFARNNAFPIGGGLYVPILRPDLKLAPPYTEWTFSGSMTRMPEFTAPALGNKENVVTVNANIPAKANGVIYSLGGFSGGLSLYMQNGILSYEYNLFEISRTHIKANKKLAAGNVEIEVITTYAEKKAAGPLNVVIKVDGIEVAKGLVPVSAPVGFTANDCLDVGIDLGSPVSIDYFDDAPFKFDGSIDEMQVKYIL